MFFYALSSDLNVVYELFQEEMDKKYQCNFRMSVYDLRRTVFALYVDI